MLGVTAITLSIYMAEPMLESANDVRPDALGVRGGVHVTFMYKQVLSEASWIDVIVHGEGEENIVDLLRAHDEERWPAERKLIKGIA